MKFNLSKASLNSNYVTPLLKMIFALCLIFWLVTSGKLDFSTMKILWEEPKILTSILLFWSLGCSGICALRWRALLNGLNLNISVFNAIKLNLVGSFFNSIMPGAIGGDVIKAIYVCKGQNGSTKIPVLLSILLDRIIGLISLFLISALAILFNWSNVYSIPTLRPLIFVIFSVIFSVAFFVGFVILPSSIKNNVPPFLYLKKLIFSINFTKNIYMALQSYKQNKLFVLQALFLSTFFQLCYTLIFVQVSQVFIQQPMNFGMLASILPIGILTTALPISPGGLGLGHLAFENLFLLINLHSGANIFNVMFFSILCLNLTGFIPYLLLKKDMQFIIDSPNEETSRG